METAFNNFVQKSIVTLKSSAKLSIKIFPIYLRPKKLRILYLTSMGIVVVRQGSVVRVVRVGSVGTVGRRSKVGGMIVPVSFWEVSTFRPNFLVLKAEKFALFSLPCGRLTFIYQCF